jgi:hypothetical protein
LAEIRGAEVRVRRSASSSRHAATGLDERGEVVDDSVPAAGSDVDSVGSAAQGEGVRPLADEQLGENAPRHASERGREAGGWVLGTAC